MRRILPPELEACRVLRGPVGSDPTYGNNGVFQYSFGGPLFVMVVSDGRGWDHVSLHMETPDGPRTPTWSEMLFVKGLWFTDDEWVIQYMPPKSKNINVHEHTLHMWRPQDEAVRVPPEWMV